MKVLGLDFGADPDQGILTDFLPLWDTGKRCVCNSINNNFK